MTDNHSSGALLRLTLGTNNLYAQPDSAGLTLIDAGPDYEGAWEELDRQLRTAGFAPAAVHTVLLTHHHLDHAGLAARWQRQGARLLIGRADAAALAMDDAERQAERVLARAELLRHGVPPEALTGGGSVGERFTRWPSPLRMTATAADALLDNGDRIGRERVLRIVACPGHTPGTLLALDEASGAVFTGDHVLPRMAPTSGIQFVDGVRRPSLPAYLASLQRVLPHPAAANGPTIAAYPGHGEAIADLHEAAAWAIRLLEQRARRTRSQLQQGPGTAYELARRMFPHLGPRHLRPALAEALGLLDLLAERGQAHVDDSEAVTLWYPSAP